MLVVVVVVAGVEGWRGGGGRWGLRGGKAEGWCLGRRGELEGKCKKEKHRSGTAVYGHLDRSDMKLSSRLLHGVVVVFLVYIKGHTLNNVRGAQST